MWKCKKCGNDFNIDWRKDKKTIQLDPTPKFCCRACANSRERPQELRTRVSEKMRKKPIKWCSYCKTKPLNKTNASGICMDCQIVIKEKIRLGEIEPDSELYRFKFIKVTNQESVKRHRRKYKRLLIEYKGGKCIVCDYNKFDGALDFHHLNPNEKDFSIGSTRKNTYNLELIKKEVDKCVLLCSNCHREFHAGLINLEDYLHKSS